MDLPLVLAGPILRRVDPGLVAVWMAFSSPATLELRVWEGRVAFDTTNPVFASSDDPPDLAEPLAAPPNPGAEAVRIGEKLYLGMVSARIPAASGKSFQPDRLYSYDVLVTAEGETRGLGELGMLAARTVSGVEVPPLGYAERMLPSFAPPPSELDHLRVAYGSCRRPSYDDGDALAWMDEVIEPRVGDPRARLHQLFLGGDQIYADDVGRLMMPHVIELGVELIGRDGSGPADDAIERIKVDTVQRLRVMGQPPDARHPATSYRDESPDETAADGDLRAGARHFPPGNRLDLTQRSAQFTSIDGDNHLISFGEFAALYLMVWSPACWGETVTGANLRLGNDERPLLWREDVGENHRIVYTTPGFPEAGKEDSDFPEIANPDPARQAPKYPDRIPKHLFVEPEPEGKKGKEPSAEEIARKKAEDEARRDRGRRASHRVHREFLRGLGRVQRVLANVPTYMILDDHDLTDDIFLNPLWRNRVLGSNLGQVILTNGMLAYALFQDWGNDPRRYDQVTDAAHPNLGGQLPGDLLALAPRYFAEGRKTGPDPEVFTRLGKMFGHDLHNKPDPDGRFRAVRPPITWHFSVDGPRHQVVALDNRTQRSYAAEIGPPGNVSKEALVDQLPQQPLAAGREVLIVIAPLQVIGPAVLDELVSPAIYRIFDMAKAGKLAKDGVSGSRRMPGTNPDALETWALEPLAFEHLLERLATFKRVVLLSGDVHNSTGNLMSYWRGAEAEPARIAQFTSSGFKNVMPVYLRALDQSAMLLQQLLRANIGVERFGWDRPDDDLILLPEGRTTDDLVAATRTKLLRSPVLLPAHGWIDDSDGSGTQPEKTSRLNPAKPPEWRWKIVPLRDDRSDVDEAGDPDFETHRPRPIQSKPIDEALVEAQVAGDSDQLFEALQTLAGRHQAALDRMRNARQMLFRSNFGVCRFTTDDDGAVTAVHELYTEGVESGSGFRTMDKYLVQKALLGPAVEEPPHVLRTAAIERRPIPPAPPP